MGKWGLKIKWFIGTLFVLFAVYCFTGDKGTYLNGYNLEVELSILSTKYINTFGGKVSRDTKYEDGKKSSNLNDNKPKIRKNSKERLRAKNLNEEVFVSAHRGFPLAFPENTTYAFDKALQLGAYSLELDVQFTSDGEMIIMHDETVDRTTNGNGEVKNLPLSYIKQLDAGIKFKPEFKDVRVPTFNEVAKVLQRSRHCFIEIKAFRTEEDIKKLVQAVIDNGLEDKAVIISFKYDKVIPYIRAISKKIKVGIIAGNQGHFEHFLPYAIADKNTVMLIEKNLAIPNNLKACDKNNIEVWVWTLTDETTMYRLMDIGYRRFICDKYMEVYQ